MIFERLLGKSQVEYLKASQVRIIIVLFLISIIVRIAVFISLSVQDVGLFGDEKMYYNRAVDFKNILDDILSGRSVSSAALESLYRGGKWPPLQSLLLIPGLFVFGHTILYARLIVVVLSATTTVLVYILTLRLSTIKVAVFAGFIHVFYPPFIFFSHYLWSESTYILLLLSCIYFTVLTIDVRSGWRKMIYAALSGCFLGLSGLTRAAVLPLIVVIPLSLIFFLKKNSDKLLAPLVVLFFCFIMLLPWQCVLLSMEKRFVPISTSGGSNLYLGNHPWIPKGLGSSWGHKESSKLMIQSIQEYSQRNQIDQNIAARRLAINYIKQDIKGFSRRCVERLRMLWTIDFFTLRNIFRVVYPPMPSKVVMLISLIIIFSYLFFITFIIWGFSGNSLGFRHRGLILSLVVAGTIPPLITIAMSRLHLPLLALLLPVVGHSLANFWSKAHIKRLVFSVLLMLTLFLFIFPTFQIVIRQYVKPSSCYAGVIHLADSILGGETFFSDKVNILYTGVDSSDCFPLAIYTENTPDGTYELKHYWQTTRENRIVQITMKSSGPSKLRIFSEKLNKSVVVEPVNKRFWKQWLPTGLDQIEYMWVGGAQGHPVWNPK